MRPTDQGQRMRMAVHDLAQHCASATLAVDTSLELARRAAVPAVILRLEAAAEELAHVQRRLRELGRLLTA